MNKNVVFLFSTLLVSAAISGQDFYTVAGQIKDSKTHLPLEFATIGIKGKSVGTVSNSKGSFEFHIPSELSIDTLLVSYVGYENYYLNISQHGESMPLMIGLKQKPMVLDEILIRAKSVGAKDIVKTAIKRIKDNYPDEPFRLECFFREIEIENDKCVQVSEAAIQLYDKSFITKRGSLQEYINVLGVRRSHSHRQMKGYNNLGSAIVDLIENNDVCYQDGMLKIKKNQYQLDSLSYYNDRLVYVISMSNRLDSGTLLIDTETYAFIKISLERRKRNYKTHPYYFNWPYVDSLRLGRVMFSFSVEFRELNGKMYPSYMNENEESHVYDPDTNSVSIYKHENLELVVNEIVTGNTAGNFKKRKLSRDYTIEIGEYDELFWKHYNILKLSPLDTRMIADLVKEMSVEDHFKQLKK